MHHTKDRELLNNVKDAYKEIPHLWDRLRRNPSREWRWIESLIHQGDRVLDVGCGNGRFFELLRNKNIAYTGIDSNAELIEIAQSRYGAVCDGACPAHGEALPPGVSTRRISLSAVRRVETDGR